MKSTKPQNQRVATKPEVVTLRIPADWPERLDAWRREQRDLPGRNEAIRRLVEFALKKG